MQMNHAAFVNSPALRVSLKRGIARQAIATAGRTAANLPGLFELVADLRPNRKGLARAASRVKGQPGVVHAALTREGKGLVFISRFVRDIVVQAEGEEMFRETGLIYLRSCARVERGEQVFQLGAVSFCGHALERLVERSALPLDCPLLPVVDAEARHIFRSWNRREIFLDAGGHYCPAATSGVWAGRDDAMGMEDDWGLVGCTCTTLPIFSVRTFLGESEMRPTVRLHWKVDPTCQMACQMGLIRFRFIARLITRSSRF